MDICDSFLPHHSDHSFNQFVSAHPAGKCMFDIPLRRTKPIALVGQSNYLFDVFRVEQNNCIHEAIPNHAQHESFNKRSPIPRVNRCIAEYPKWNSQRVHLLFNRLVLHIFSDGFLNFPLHNMFRIGGRAIDQECENDRRSGCTQSI